MSAFKKLKLIKDAMSPDAIRQGLEASREALRAGADGRPAGLSDEQLAALTPEQRAAYDAQMAKAAAVEAQVAADAVARVEAERHRRALSGPAGEHVYGALPSAEVPMTVEATLARSKDEFMDVLRNPLGRRKPPPPPAPAAPDVAGDRDAQAAAERAARDAARQPYLAPGRGPLTFARLATREKTQIEEVAAYLGSSGLAGRPDLVYGIYRVPDHIGGGLTLGRSRVIEWDVVHAATTRLPAAPAAGAAWFDAGEAWVARRPGEPSVLDEDLALTFLARAGIGPEQCLGIARFLHIEQSSTDDSVSYTVSRVAGVHAFHAAGLGGGALEALRAERPLAASPVPGVHVEVLNWRAVAQAVHPASHQRFTVPSPFPHLPSTPQELLRAYIEIVGVRPEDCFSAQVTEDGPRDINSVTTKGMFTVTTNTGEKQPCADGEERRRLTGGARIVVVHRDRPAYGEGRERWAAYERDVLESSLANGTGVRRPVESRDVLERLPGPARRLLKAAEFVADIVDDDPTGRDPFEDIPPHRYCWPPQS